MMNSILKTDNFIFYFITWFLFFELLWNRLSTSLHFISKCFRCVSSAKLEHMPWKWHCNIWQLQSLLSMSTHFTLKLWQLSSKCLGKFSCKKNQQNIFNVKPLLNCFLYNINIIWEFLGNKFYASWLVEENKC